MRLIVGITGATRALFGVRLLEALHDLPDVETHLVLSSWNRMTIELETPPPRVRSSRLADVHHSVRDQAAAVASGSFCTAGMVIAQIHLENMLALTRMGAVMVPPLPASHNHPRMIGDIVHQVVARVLDQFDLPHLAHAAAGARRGPRPAPPRRRVWTIKEIFHGL